MKRTCNLLFCDNEHGTGDVTFPVVDEMDGYAVKQMFVEGKQTIGALRKAAKKEGWGVVNGGDYCPGCMASM